MNYFLQNNNIIRSTSTWQEVALAGANNRIKNRAKTEDQNFSDDFVNYKDNFNFKYKDTE